MNRKQRDRKQRIDKCIKDYNTLFLDFENKVTKEELDYISANFLNGKKISEIYMKMNPYKSVFSYYVISDEDLESFEKSLDYLKAKKNTLN